TLNGGPVLKFNGTQKYTTDGVTGAKFKSLCKRAGVPCQIFVNHSDVPGGSTLGNISTSHVSIPSVDIGLPQLAMHSAVETGGTKDTLMAIKVMKEYFSE
ncbi:MAG: M18 family aminopeptidase, partial [Lachnospiraceae bacterium]|nr:M18 family aminopeptidase [Lachnospiraceae bacterium]